MTKDQAVKWAGGVTALAERLGITQSAVSQWEEVPELQQHRLTLLSGGKLLVDPRYLPKPAQFAKQP